MEKEDEGNRKTTIKSSVRTIRSMREVARDRRESNEDIIKRLLNFYNKYLPVIKRFLKMKEQRKTKDSNLTSGGSK